jgi:hypothetical protein
MSFTNCRICVSSTYRAKNPPIEFYVDIEDKHIIDIGGEERMGRIVGRAYIDSQLSDYIRMAYDTEVYKYVSVAVPDERNNNKDYHAEMFITIG